jgi:uncharacterized membrane protein
MNAAQIHLALNHLPIGLVLVGVPLLIASLVRKSKELRGAASIVLILSALATIPVFLSGEPTEEIVEHRPGVTEHLIHEHEEAGELSLIFVEILGALVLVAWLLERFKGRAPSPIWFGIVALGVINLGLFVRTAHLGGLIRHDELRPAGAASGPTSSREAAEKEGHDD